MIRFVEFTGVYLDETKSFGFYDTAKDVFLTLNDTQCFDDIEELEDMYTDDCGYDIDRLRRKIPDEWKGVKSTKKTKNITLTFTPREINAFTSIIDTIESMQGGSAEADEVIVGVSDWDDETKRQIKDVDKMFKRNGYKRANQLSN